MVELAWVQDEAQLVAHVAQSIGVALSGLDTGATALAELLRTRHMLIVLDNCEHLLDAVGELATRLLGGAPQVRLLVTSQELLRVGGEHVYRLAPLAVPRERDPQAALGYGAVRLFVERARALERRFELDQSNVDAVVDICISLDGIALAIELAAARVPMLGVFGILDRLGERLRVLTGGSRVSLRRHQTLRAALDWSHNLLDAHEQRVFRRLGLFSGGFFVESAQMVASDDDIDAWAVLDHLSALVDKSLVLVDAGTRPRYRLLETSRAYAMERLAEAGETDAWMRRHAEGTQTLCEKAVRQRDSEWIWAESNNIRAAYEWAVHCDGDDVIAVSLACMPAMVLSVRGFVAESLQRMLQVESLVTDAVPKALAARYWQWLGRIGIEGRLPTSRCIDALGRAEGMFRELGNVRHVHACLRMRAEALVTQADLSGAAQALEQAQALESAGLPVADRLRRLRVQGLLHGRADRAEASLAALTSAWEMACAAGIERYQLILLADMANVHLKLGQASTAAQQFRSLADKARRSRGQGLTLAHALAGLSAALLMQPDVAEATQVAVRAVVPLRRSGLLVAYCDLYAWLMACHDRVETCGQLLGAADEFHRYSETARSAIEHTARARALQMLQAGQSAASIEGWMRAGAAVTADDIARMLERAVAPFRADGASPLGDTFTDTL
jgi:predicted ATPase